MKKTCLKLLINVISFSFPSRNSYDYHFSALVSEHRILVFVQNLTVALSNIHYSLLLDFIC